MRARVLPVQRFADLALSTLRLVYVAQHCGITEPERGEEGKKQQPVGREKSTRLLEPDLLRVLSVE